jgi:hypothetical protein
MNVRGKVTWLEKGRPQDSPGHLSAGQAEVGRQLAYCPAPDCLLPLLIFLVVLIRPEGNLECL